MNWSVKMLFISGIQNESDIIEGYAYATALREEYTNSNGARGAFVVAANLSAGIDNGLPADHQLWCDQYESMGEAGILGVCATTNANANVDSSGDMPTTCSSEYLVAVTNTGMDDNKLLFAGYGATHIDLGAPGTTTLTTSISNDYDDFIGTSAASPHVTGALGVMYAVACEDLISLAGSDPAALARQMKALLLTSIDPVSSLVPITASGGRLNVGKAVGAIVDLCGNSGGALSIVSITPNPVFESAEIIYTIANLNPYQLSVYDSAGRLLLSAAPEVVIPGEQSYHLVMPSLVPGVYHVAITQGKTVASASILVQ
jgi:subtilisin family serine protease